MSFYNKSTTNRKTVNIATSIIFPLNKNNTFKTAIENEFLEVNKEGQPNLYIDVLETVKQLDT